MTPSSIQTRASELVPIADRMRLMHGFRLLAAVCAALSAVIAVNPLSASVTALVAVTATYIALSFGAHAIGKLSGHGAIFLFGSMLIVDGVYLAWASYATGGAASPLRYLIVVHLIAVALLASFRTGLKLALWHSLLLLVVHYAQEARILARTPDAVGLGTPFQQLLVFSGVFWFVALLTATFSAVNERELRRRRYDLEALARMATRLDSATEAREVADVLTGAVADTFDFPRAVLLAAPLDGDLTLAAHVGAQEGVAEAAPGPGSVVSEALTARATQFVSRLDP